MATFVIVGCASESPSCDGYNYDSTSISSTAISTTTRPRYDHSTTFVSDRRHRGLKA